MVAPMSNSGNGRQLYGHLNQLVRRPSYSARDHFSSNVQESFRRSGNSQTLPSSMWQIYPGIPKKMNSAIYSRPMVSRESSCVCPNFGLSFFNSSLNPLLWLYYCLGVDNQGRLNGRAFVELPTADELARVMESNSEEPFVLGDRDLSLRRATAPPVTWRRGVNNVLHIPNYPCPGDEGPLREALGDAQDKIRQVDFCTSFFFFHKDLWS
jgi:hypothetical protein